MQNKTTELATNSAKTGLKIDKKKTKILRTNTTCNTPIMLKEEPITEVDRSHSGILAASGINTKVQIVVLKQNWESKSHIPHVQKHLEV